MIGNLEPEIKEKVDEANTILTACDPDNAEEMKELFVKYNVSKEDEFYVKELSRNLRTEKAANLTIDRPRNLRIVKTPPDTKDPNEGISSFGAYCSATGMVVGSWAIYDSPITTSGTYVSGIGGGATLQFPHPFQYGNFKVKTSYLGSEKTCGYELNSFAFIVSYTNINLFDDDGWVGTFHGGGFSAGINISGGIATFTNLLPGGNLKVNKM